MREGDIVPYTVSEHMDGKMRLRSEPAMITGISDTESGQVLDLKVFHRGGGIENIHGVRQYDHAQHGWFAGGGFVQEDWDFERDWQDIPEAPDGAGERPALVQPAYGGPMRRETPEETDQRLNATRPGPRVPARGFENTTGEAEANRSGSFPRDVRASAQEAPAAEPTPAAPPVPQSTDSTPMSSPKTFDTSSPSGGANRD